MEKNMKNHLFHGSMGRTVACLLPLLLIVGGLLLMGGPASTADHFQPDIFSARRTRLAPMLCLAGYLLVLRVVLRKR